MSARRTMAGLIIMTIGVTFIGVTFASRLFDVAPAFEEMTVAFRTQMTDENIATMRRDLTSMDAVSEEFTTKVVPTLAGALKITPEEFTAVTERQWPAVATGVTALPQIGARFGTVANTLDAEQTRFASADAIPTTSLSSTTVPWTVLIIGIGAIIIGALVLRPSRVGPTIAVLLGASLVIATLALSLPRKASDADLMNDHLKPVYTQALVDQGRQSLAVITAMGAQMQDEMLPALGQTLGLTPEGVTTFVEDRFPVTAAALAQMPTMLARFTTTIGTFDDNLANFNTAKTQRLGPVSTTLLIGGALMFLIATLAFGGTPEAGHATVHGIHLRRKAA